MSMENTTSSRNSILAAIRNARPQAIDLPEVPHYQFEGDRIESFKTLLHGFDGRFVEFENRAAAIDYLNQNLDKSLKIFSTLPDYPGTITNADFKTPHDANVIHSCVSEGVFGVAETGSIWVTNRSLSLAAAALFSTDLYLLLDKSKIIGNLHDAYRIVDFKNEQYGSFFTGPSATADIEAIHVTGAQGEISLTALLY